MSKLTNILTKKALEDSYCKKGMSIKEVAEKFGCGGSSIFRYLKKHNIAVRDERGSGHRYTVNDDYFEDIDTPAKAYLLGFILGDGYISRDGIPPSVGLHINMKDIEIINYLKSEVGYPYTAGCPTFSSASSSPAFMFRMYRSKIREDILSHGVVASPHTNKEKFVVLSTPELTWHMLRGVSDADGCICTSTNKEGKILRASWSITISKRFIQGMVKFLLSQGIDVSGVQIRQIPGTSRLSFSTRKTLQKFGRKLYADADFYLKRKYAKFEPLL